MLRRVKRIHRRLSRLRNRHRLEAVYCTKNLMDTQGARPQKDVIMDAARIVLQ